MTTRSPFKYFQDHLYPNKACFTVAAHKIVTKADTPCKACQEKAGQPCQKMQLPPCLLAIATRPLGSDRHDEGLERCQAQASLQAGPRHVVRQQAATGTD